jgi:hypothetical protein
LPFEQNEEGQPRVNGATSDANEAAAKNPFATREDSLQTTPRQLRIRDRLARSPDRRARNAGSTWNAHPDNSASQQTDDLGTGLGDGWRAHQGHSGSLKDNGQNDRKGA